MAVWAPPGTFQLWSSSLPIPQSVSTQPTIVFSPYPLSKPHIPSLSPRQLWWTPISGWGEQGCGTDHLYKSHSFLPATDQLLHFPPVAPEAPILCQLISLQVRGLPQVQEPVLSFSSHTPGGQVLSVSSFLLLPFLSFILPSYAGIFSCPIRCLRSSASVQQVLCENCSICRYILVVLVERGEFHILLFCHLEPSPWRFFLLEKTPSEIISSTLLKRPLSGIANRTCATKFQGIYSCVNMTYLKNAPNPD